MFCNFRLVLCNQMIWVIQMASLCYYFSHTAHSVWRDDWWLCITPTAVVKHRVRGQHGNKYICGGDAGFGDENELYCMAINYPLFCCSPVRMTKCCCYFAPGKLHSRSSQQYQVIYFCLIMIINNSMKCCGDMNFFQFYRVLADCLVVYVKKVPVNVTNQSIAVGQWIINSPTLIKA